MSKENSDIQHADIITPERARARRVESMRKSMGFSRRAFEERYGVSASTLQNWEDVKLNGLTEKGATKLIRALKSDGVGCTLEWLMFGVGSAPQIPEHLIYKQPVLAKKRASQVVFDNDEQDAIIAKELLLFREHHPHAIDLVVKDDGMAPRFIIGDYVAGVRRNKVHIKALLGLDCIVQTQEGDILLRKLKPGTADGFYTLACSNPNAEVKKPILYDVELIAAAPVIWMRRKDINYEP